MAESFTAASLTRYLHDHIPLTRHLEVTVIEVNQDRVVLSAPLVPNINHRDTAFGGSLASVAILAGWSWLHARLTALGKGQRLVVSESTATFSQPVDENFLAVCEAPADAEFQRFQQTLERKGKARLLLQSHVLSREVVAVEHSATFVAIAH
jgi:thioesterase domain-containing protein